MQTLKARHPLVVQLGSESVKNICETGYYPLVSVQDRKHCVGRPKATHFELEKRTAEFLPPNNGP